MSDSPSVPDSVPTLTEVVRPAPATPAPGSDPAVLGQALIVEQVLAALQAQIQPALDKHLRAAMAPALTRAAEQLVHELRLELARSLRELVGNAVAQELARSGAVRSGQI